MNTSIDICINISIHINIPRFDPRTTRSRSTITTFQRSADHDEPIEKPIGPIADEDRFKTLMKFTNVGFLGFPGYAR